MTTREQIISIAEEVKANNDMFGNFSVALYSIAFEAGRKSVNTEFALAEAYRCGEEAGRQAEREACAVVCDYHGDDDNGYGCAAAIRARGDSK